MKTSLVIGGSIVIPVLFIVGTLVAIRAINQHEVQKRAVLSQQEMAQQREQAMGDTYGSSSAKETLNALAAAIRSNDVEVAAKLSVPALRDHMATQIQSLEQEGRESASRALEQAAKGMAEPGGVVVTVSEPVYVELIKYPSGVWRVASF